MATAFTHAFTGGVLARLGCEPVSTRKLALVLAVMAVLPDLDVLGFWLGVPYGHPLGHRGLTHSLPFAALAGVAVGWLVFPEVRSNLPAMRRVVLLTAAATASHGVLDALTDAGRGVGFFIPFESGRYFFPWRPLETSPIEVDRVLSWGTFRIFASELLWVWLPIVIGFGFRWIWNRAR